MKIKPPSIFQIRELTNKMLYLLKSELTNHLTQKTPDKNKKHKQAITSKYATHIFDSNLIIIWCTVSFGNNFLDVLL